MGSSSSITKKVLKRMLELAEQAEEELDYEDDEDDDDDIGDEGEGTSSSGSCAEPQQAIDTELVIRLESRIDRLEDERARMFHTIEEKTKSQQALANACHEKNKKIKELKGLIPISSLDKTIWDQVDERQKLRMKEMEVDDASTKEAGIKPDPEVMALSRESLLNTALKSNRELGEIISKLENENRDLRNLVLRCVALV